MSVLGVQITAPVAGVAVGLVTIPKPESAEEIEDFRVLTDINGMEDYLGDMDFKVAGTRRGFTAMQLDLKIPGIPVSVLNAALNVATKSKKDLLSIMKATLSEPRAELKENGPISEEMEIPAHKRAKFIGLGKQQLTQKFLAGSFSRDKVVSREQ